MNWREDVCGGIRGATMENIGVARTDLMVAGCAVPFSIVGFSGRHVGYAPADGRAASKDES